jgi:hypothetical protein
LSTAPFAPGQVDHLFLRRAFHPCREFDQRVARVWLASDFAVEHDVLHRLAQFGRKVVIHAQLAGIDDAHGEAGLDRVIEEHGVDRLAHGFVAAEGKRHVGNAARGARMRQVLLDPAHRLDEIHRVVVVLRNARGDGENVRVENDVFGRKAVGHQQIVGAFADFDLALPGVGLALLVEGHDDHRRAVAPRQARLFEELRRAFLHRDGIDDALALDALEAGFDDVPLRAVEHQRHLADVRLGADQVQEAHHRRLRIEHGLVHVDVDHLCAVLDLLAGDGQRIVVAAFEDHAGEGFRAGDVGALADVDEQAVVADVEGFESGQAQARKSAAGGHRARLAMPFDRLRRSRAMCSGVVPQQPPAMLTKPALARTRWISVDAVISRRLVEAGVRHRRSAARRSG